MGVGRGGVGVGRGGVGVGRGGVGVGKTGRQGTRGEGGGGAKDQGAKEGPIFKFVHYGKCICFLSALFDFLYIFTKSTWLYRVGLPNIR